MIKSFYMYFLNKANVCHFPSPLLDWLFCKALHICHKCVCGIVCIMLVGNMYTVEQQWFQPLTLARWPCPLFKHCQKDHERRQEHWREGGNVSGWSSGPVINMNNAPVSNYSYLDFAHFPNLELLVTGFWNSICVSLFIFIYANPHHSLFISMGVFFWDPGYA
jgi:hypothetical protein